MLADVSVIHACALGTHVHLTFYHKIHKIWSKTNTTGEGYKFQVKLSDVQKQMLLTIDAFISHVEYKVIVVIDHNYVRMDSKFHFERHL